MFVLMYLVDLGCFVFYCFYVFVWKHLGMLWFYLLLVGLMSFVFALGYVFVCKHLGMLWFYLFLLLVGLVYSDFALGYDFVCKHLEMLWFYLLLFFLVGFFIASIAKCYWVCLFFFSLCVYTFFGGCYVVGFPI